jgi:hypothetical protein
MEPELVITPFLIVFGLGLVCGFWLGWRWGRSDVAKMKEEIVDALRQELAEWALE